MTMITLDQAIETVMELPFEQQEMLLEIVRLRHIEARRREIAVDTKESLAAYRAGMFEPKTAEYVIAELRATYPHDEVY
jgi:hypothetical protein